MKATITLKKNYEFKKLLSKGKLVKGKYVTIYFHFSENLSQNNKNEIGFIVSKKSGNSVFRNRTRRIIRQAYSELEDQTQKGYKLLIMWKKENEEKDIKSVDIKEDLYNCFSEKGII